VYTLCNQYYRWGEGHQFDLDIHQIRIDCIWLNPDVFDLEEKKVRGKYNNDNF